MKLSLSQAHRGLGLILLATLGSGTQAQGTRGGPVKTAEFSLHIYHQPEDVLACVGDTATFQVTTLTASATFLWRKNGTPIVPSETNSVLNISPVSAADAGSYDVLVSKGPKTLVSDAALLTVNDVPTITSQPKNQNVHVGDSASFSVAATGDGDLEYQWKVQNTPFGGWNIIPGATSPTYLIESVGGSDTGKYRCHVTNHCGQKISASARLSIRF